MNIDELSVDSSYVDLATTVRELDDQIAHHTKALSALKKDREALTDGIIPQKMTSEGLSTVNVCALGRFSVRSEMRVTVAGGKKFELQDWLKDNGYGELIGTTINSSTLKSFVKERMTEGDDYPEELLNLHMFERATLTKI